MTLMKDIKKYSINGQRYESEHCNGYDKSVMNYKQHEFV